MTPVRTRLPAALLGLIVALSLAGCITIGADFRHEAVDLIKVGQTSDRDVLKLFGNPLRTGVAEDGLKEWTYVHYRASLFGKFEGRDLILKFDSGGKVQSIGYRTTDPTDKAAMAK